MFQFLIKAALNVQNSDETNDLWEPLQSNFPSQSPLLVAVPTFHWTAPGQLTTDKKRPPGAP
jgi:hypothetical protein